MGWGEALGRSHLLGYTQRLYLFSARSEEVICAAVKNTFLEFTPVSEVTLALRRCKSASAIPVEHSNLEKSRYSGGGKPVLAQRMKSQRMMSQKARRVSNAQPQNVQSCKRRERAFSEETAHGSPTTLMLRGIPCSITQLQLRCMLDEAGLAHAYDFLYLPCIRHTQSNLGYAFVNLKNIQNAQKCAYLLHGARLAPERSQKVCTVARANIQGVEALQRHFRRTEVCKRNRGPWFLHSSSTGVRLGLENLL